MKQSNRKSSPLSLVTVSAGRAGTPEEDKVAELRESFDGWVTSVAPSLLQSTMNGNPSVAHRAQRSLTSLDHIRVNRATVRESTEHRHWPPDVVIKFMTAEVITRSQKH